MDEFPRDFCRVLRAATEYGAYSRPPRENLPDGPFATPSEHRKFIAACHRGYQKAQDSVIGLLSRLNVADSLHEGERDFRERVLRRVIDAIAFMMLRTETHVARRLSLQLAATRPLDLPAIRAAQSEANRLNGESRLTFALVADLSTFIHVVDLLRVDFRNMPPRLSLIELKTGRVNDLLLSHLQNYQADPAALRRITDDDKIDQRHRQQARRMLMQRVRLRQIEELLAHDEGMDPGLQCRVKLFGPTVAIRTYDRQLDELCAQARSEGAAAGSVHFCLHLGLGYANEPQESRNRALLALRAATDMARSQFPSGFHAMLSDLSTKVPGDEVVRAVNLLEFNLAGTSDRPFPLWSIHSDHKVSLVRGHLTIFTAFDLAGFLVLTQELGIRAELTTRREAEHKTSNLPRWFFPRWGHRLVRLYPESGEPILMGGGIVTRMINDLSTPVEVLRACTRGTSS